MTPEHIIDSIGAERIAEALHTVTLRRVKRVRTMDRIPASWYDGLERLAGHELPREVFTFKGLDR